MQLEDIQITKTYPPEVEEIRQRILAIMADLRREAELDAAAISPYQRPNERIMELMRIERRYQTQQWPFVEELSLLENYATVTASFAPEDAGKMMVLPNPGWASADMDGHSLPKTGGAQ